MSLSTVSRETGRKTTTLTPREPADKTEDAKKIFAEHGPIDVNWVNVGGKSFEEELEFMNMHGRLIGMSSTHGYLREPERS